MDDGKQANKQRADMADKSTLDAKALSKLKCTSVRNQRFFSL